MSRKLLVIVALILSTGLAGCASNRMLSTQLPHRSVDDIAADITITQEGLFTVYTAPAVYRRTTERYGLSMAPAYPDPEYFAKALVAENGNRLYRFTFRIRYDYNMRDKELWRGMPEGPIRPESARISPIPGKTWEPELGEDRVTVPITFEEDHCEGDKNAEYLGNCRGAQVAITFALNEEQMQWVAPHGLSVLFSGNRGNVGNGWGRLEEIPSQYLQALVRVSQPQ